MLSYHVVISRCHIMLSADNLRKYKFANIKVFPTCQYSSTVLHNLLHSVTLSFCSLVLYIYAVCKVLCFILSDDDFEKKSKIYSHNCLSCFIHILNCKMTLFFGMRSFVNKAKLHGFKKLSTKMKLYYIHNILRAQKRAKNTAKTQK